MQEHTDDLFSRYTSVCEDLEKCRQQVIDLRAEIARILNSHHDEQIEMLRLVGRVADLEDIINQLKSENAALAMTLRREAEDRFIAGRDSVTTMDNHNAAVHLIQVLTEERNELLQRLAKIDMEGRRGNGTSKKKLLLRRAQSEGASNAMSGRIDENAMSLTLAPNASVLAKNNDDDDDDDDDSGGGDGYARPQSQRTTEGCTIVDERIRELQETAERESAALAERIHKERESQLRTVEDHLRKKREARMRQQGMAVSPPSSAAAGPSKRLSGEISPTTAGLAEAFFGTISPSPAQQGLGVPASSGARQRRSIVAVLQEQRSGQFDPHSSGVFHPPLLGSGVFSPQQPPSLRQSVEFPGALPVSPTTSPRSLHVQSTLGRPTLSQYHAFSTSLESTTAQQQQQSAPIHRLSASDDPPRQLSVVIPDPLGINVDSRPGTSSSRPGTSGNKRVYRIPESALQDAFPEEKYQAVESVSTGRVLIVKKRHNKISQRAPRWATN